MEGRLAKRLGFVILAGAIAGGQPPVPTPVENPAIIEVVQIPRILLSEYSSLPEIKGKIDLQKEKLRELLGKEVTLDINKKNWVLKASKEMPIQEGFRYIKLTRNVAGIHDFTILVDLDQYRKLQSKFGNQIKGTTFQLRIEEFEAKPTPRFIGITIPATTP